MKKKNFWQKIIFLSLILTLSILPVRADELTETLEEEKNRLQSNESKQAELRAEIDRLQNEGRSLSNQVAYLESQIQLTEVEIAIQEEEITAKEIEMDQYVNDIEKIKTKLSLIDEFMTKLSGVLKARVRSAYKKSQVGGELSLLFQAKEELQDLINGYQYLKAVEEQDKRLMLQMESTQADYNVQVENLETKKEEILKLKQELILAKEQLEAENTDLIQQRMSKDYLLRITQNDESNYQALMAQAQAEQVALQNAVNTLYSLIGNPENGEVKKRGDILGKQGSSGGVTGEHLHFGVYIYNQDDLFNHRIYLCYSHVDPAPYINSGEFMIPISNPRFTSIPDLYEYNANDNYFADNLGISQVYGKTNFALLNQGIYGQCPNYPYHNGIDLIGPMGGPIYAVADGIAYTVRSESQGNSVFIFHDNGLMTLYHHLR